MALLSFIGLMATSAYAISNYDPIYVEQVVEEGNYTFKFVEPQHSEVPGNTTGRIEYDNETIYIETHRNITEMATTCRHEVIHGEHRGMEHSKVYEYSEKWIMPLCDRVMFKVDEDKLTIK